MRGLTDRWKGKRNALVLRVADHFNVDGVHQIRAQVGKRQGPGNLIVASPTGDLRTQAKAGSAFVEGREIDAGGPGNQAERQNEPHDQRHG